MPNYLSEVQLPGGAEYSFKDTLARTIEGSMTPIDSHTWTGVTTTANTDAAGYLYFAKLQPTSYADDWEIGYRVHAIMDGVSVGNGKGEETSYVYFYGARAYVHTYKTWNNIVNTGYRPYYNHVVYRAKQAGIDTNHKGHALGLRLYSSYNPNVSTYARTIQIDILYMKDCTITWIDPMVVYADMDGTGSTNYDGRGDYDGNTQGETHSGDRNDYAHYVRFPYTHFTAGTGGLKGYSIILQDGSGTWQSVHTTNATTATNKVKNPVGFRLGQVYYLNSGSNFAAGAVTGDATITTMHTLIDARYSFNVDTDDLIGNKEVYLVGEIHSDGLFYLDSTWWTQTEPSSDNGKVYVPIGYSRLNGSNTYQIDFKGWRGAYWYKNGCFQEVVLSAATVNGHTVNKDVPSDAVFTDTTDLTQMTGTLPASKGGTGETSLRNASNSLINALDTGVATKIPERTDYFISQYIGGNADNSAAANANKYYRRPISVLFGAMESSDISNALGYSPSPSIYFGTCTTAAATAAKVITLDDSTGFELKSGVMICVKFTNTNTANNVTFNVNNTGAKSVSYAKNAAYAGTTSAIVGNSGYSIYYVYDGTYWCFVNNQNNYANNVDTQTSAYCATAAGTAAKVASMTYFALRANEYVHINFRYANTAASALTLNINGTGAKAIYINGSASSSSNYTLPAGSYIAFYDGTNYQFRNDDKLPANITGTVNGHSVNKDVPSNAVFTDTKDLTQMTGTLPAARLPSSGVTAGSAGPTANVNGNEGSTISIPRLTVDTYGRVTALSSYTLTTKNTTYVAGAGLFLSGTTFSNAGATGVKGEAEDTYRTGNVNITKTNIGLGNVDDKSSETIRSELTINNVINALGYTPYTRDEVDSLISVVYRFKGTKATYANITSLASKTVGDVWYCTATAKSYAWNGSAWNELGSLDLGSFYTGNIIKATSDISL